MGQGEVPEEVQVLDKRVRRLERLLLPNAKKKNIPPFSFNHIEFQGFLGWFLLTTSSIALFFRWFAGQSAPPSLALLLLFALWLVLRNLPIGGLSDSTLQLELEGRHARRVASSSVHSKPKLGRTTGSTAVQVIHQLQLVTLGAGAGLLAVSVSWLLMRQLNSAAWQLLILLACALCSLVFASIKNHKFLLGISIIVLFGMLGAAEAPMLAILCTGLAVVLGVWLTAREENWNLLFVLVVLGYMVLARWAALLQPGYIANLSSKELEKIGISLAVVLVVTLILFALPFIFRRRKSDEREIIRAILFANAIGFTIVSLWLLNSSVQTGWILTHILTLFISSICGYVAWHTHGRLSYAKYFFCIALVATIALLFAQSDRALSCSLWFIVSVLLVSTGFLISSYTLRMAGIAALAASILYYSIYLLPEPSTFGFFTLSDRLGIGVLLACFLLLLAQWYRIARLRGPELLYRQYLVEGSEVLAFLFIAGLDGVDSSGVWQSLLWLVVGVLAWNFGHYLQHHYVQSLGVALVLSGLVHIALVDSLAWESVNRLVLLGGIGLFFLLIGYVLIRYPRRFLLYLN